MAVVLNSEENSYFSSGPLRRSHSQPKFVNTSLYSKSLCRSLSSNGFPRLPESYSSQSLRDTTSCTSSCDLSDESVSFPSYHEVYYQHSEQYSPPLSSPCEDSYIVSPSLPPTTNNTLTNVSRPQSPDVVERAEDDTAIKIPPSRHVDYLSHNWSEEDIWSSWKHVVSRRKSYSNAPRLENASWRSWVKAKYKLKTVSPETLNWLKDCDVTWLYGPLQTSTEPLCNAPYTSPASCNRLSKNNSFLNKKPILKKRSMSELMLQQSLSTSSLLKQAAAAVQAQQSDTYFECSRNENIVSSTCLHVLSTCSSDLNHGNLSPTSSSDLPSIYGDKKRIHFNEQVAQCIAVDVKGDDDDDELMIPDYADSDSDDGIMMKPSTTKRKYPQLRHRAKVRPNLNQENNKIIEMLPSTTLKYQSDIPASSFDMEEDECDDELWDEDSTILTLSNSQETLKPSKPPMKIFIGEDDEEDNEDDLDWQPLTDYPYRKDSVVVALERMKNPGSSILSHDSLGDNDVDNQVELRRRSSGIFMPREEDEENITSEGLFGKVVDTVNTAKDIAHVIWNVGWRR
ncbi:putative protein phosphatase type 1 complex subunit hex2 reg1 [Erysiphe necator]|uniref:Nitrogen regulatory protein areA GATA-like domain-containing protein n=1 Tax=Uncinula necator TaxID=52586 RepID=A0A0B1P147_UNCNE|nr:putative protein phosphatase type 1 complex subunit hex2 reg1 [Erysiphe necator]